MSTQLRVVVAPDSFKGSITATTASARIADGWRIARPQDTVTELPMADGGEGTMDAIERSSPGCVRMRLEGVPGALGDLAPTEFLLLADGTAVVEIAASSGLPSLRQRAPLNATS